MMVSAGAHSPKTPQTVGSASTCMSGSSGTSIGSGCSSGSTASSFLGLLSDRIPSPPFAVGDINSEVSISHERHGSENRPLVGLGDDRQGPLVEEQPASPVSAVARALRGDAQPVVSGLFARRAGGRQKQAGALSIHTADTTPMTTAATASVTPISSLLSRLTASMKSPMDVRLDLLADVGEPPRAEQREIRQLPADRKIYDLYYWEDVLQEEGDGGKVVVCRPKETEEMEMGSPLLPCGRHGAKKPFQYVMKIRSKESLTRKGVEVRFRKTQVRMLNFPSHAGVLPIHEVLEDERFYYVIMERATGGSFFQGLLAEFEDGVVPAPMLRRLMRELLEAVRHVHGQGMLHRDIKPDNIVMELRPDASRPGFQTHGVRLIDFDHADPDFSPHTPAIHEGYFGTLKFNAPETFLGVFSQATDLYSVGCILFLLVAGRMPFGDHIFEGDADDENPNRCTRHQWRTDVFQRMRDLPIDFGDEVWNGQPACKDFCEKLLALEPEDRPHDAEKTLRHPWLALGAA